jgi:hypothetical protein
MADELQIENHDPVKKFRPILHPVNVNNFKGGLLIGQIRMLLSMKKKTAKS